MDVNAMDELTTCQVLSAVSAQATAYEAEQSEALQFPAPSITAQSPAVPEGSPAPQKGAMAEEFLLIAQTFSIFMS